MAIRICTWNVQNFARPNAGVTSDYQAKLDHLVEQLEDIQRSGPLDVIALQEILDVDGARDLAHRLGRVAVIGRPDPRGNRVATLVRDPVTDVHHVDTWRLPPGESVPFFDGEARLQHSARWPRPALRVTITVEGAPLDVYNLHFKSKLLTFPDVLPGSSWQAPDETWRAHVAFFALQRRMAEATSLRELVTDTLQADPEHRIVVAGDLNDVPEAATTQILLGPPGSQIDSLDDLTRANSGYNRRDQGDPQRLFNVTLASFPKEARWSRRYQGQGELLDQVLCSQALLPIGADGLRAPVQIEIRNGSTPSLGPDPSSGGVVPDHAPVVATFGS